MPTQYKWKTRQVVPTPLEQLERAVKEVQEGKTIAQVGKERKICRMTINKMCDDLLIWGYVSPEVHSSLAKSHRKKEQNCKQKENSTTNDEAEDGLEKTHIRERKQAEKKKRSGNKKGGLKGSKPTKPKKKVLSSSSEEGDFPIPLIDATDYESSDVQSDEDDGDKDLSAGDFVIVKFAGKKSKPYNYVGLVENVEGDEISAKFLKQICKRSVDGKHIFTFRENDEGVIPRGDVLKKLPTPKGSQKGAEVQV
ncbi:unnamed protein product [Boreogadus saida]